MVIGEVFFLTERQVFLGAVIVDVVLWAQDWALFLIFSGCPCFYALCFLIGFFWGVFHGLCCGCYVD